MTDENTLGRRRYLELAGTALTATALAGCGGYGGDGGDGGDGGGGDSPTGTPTDTTGETDTRTDTTTDGGDSTTSPGGGDVPSKVEEWMSDANNYSGLVDETGKDEVPVKVGAGDGFSFAPAAVKISKGATVSWQWTGKGGEHNVVAQSDAFDSGDPKASGDPFEQSFDNTGIYLYFCEPHRPLGMKGAIVVE